MRADTETQAAVESVLDKFADGYARRNIEGVLELFAHDADVVFIGTGSDEERHGLSGIKQQIERDLAQAGAVHWNWVEDSVSRIGSVAWVAAEAIVRVIDGIDQHLPARVTAVLQETGSSWRIAQMHVSLAANNQEEGQSYPCD